MHTDASFEQGLVQSRLDLHRGAVTVAAGSSVMVALAVSLLLLDSLGAQLALGGVLALVVSPAMRVFLSWLHHRRPESDNPARWLLRYRLACVVQGLVWMVIGLALTEGASHEHRSLVVFALTAMTAGALVSAVFDWLAAALISGLTLLPLLHLLLSDHGVHGRQGSAEAAIVLLLMGVMVVALWRAERNQRQAVRLQLDTAARAEAARRLAELADRARQQLADQHQLMTQLLANTEQGCWFIDPEGTTTQVNDAMCRLMGRSRDEIMGRSFFDWFTGEDRALVEREVAKRRSGISSRYEITFVRPDGSRRHCQNYATPIRDAQGRHLGSMGLWTDLTEHVEAERRLRVHAWAINSITDVVSVVDEHEVYQMVNYAWCRNTGVQREQALGRRTIDILPSVASPARSRALRECLDSNQVRTQQGTVNLPQMQGRQIRTHYYPYGGSDDGLRRVVLVSRDVTEEQQSLQALRASEAEKRALLDAFPGFMARLDQNLVYLYANQRLALLLGSTPDQLVGRQVEQILGPETARLVRSAIDRTRAGEVVVTERRYPATHSHPEAHLQVTYSMGTDAASGQPVFFAFGTDITGLFRAKQALEDARAEAERANRAKSQFLAQMSHELRTPLNAILGFAQLLATDSRLRLAPHHRSHLQEIQRGGEHLLSLINEVLELGRIEAGQLLLEPRPVDLAVLLAECLALVRPLAQGRQLRLRISPPTDAADTPVLVLADRLRLKQVLLNLLGNAIKYNRRGGEVETAWRDEGPGMLRISVRDSGPGIAPQDQERVFEPFERLGSRGEVEGTGIGLTLSRRLVEAMGGQIGVDSAVTTGPGAGSTFWLRLPRASGLPRTAAETGPLADSSYGSIEGTPALPAAPAAQARRPVVLYIEDNPVNVVLMEAMLARIPEVRALCLLSPSEGLAAAERERPALVLLDLQMPEMDGFEVLRRLRAAPATQSTPVYAVSANALRSDIDRALASGFDGYLTKPIDLEGLTETVRDVLRTQRGAGSV